mgnify:CR=1 FL=1
MKVETFLQKHIGLLLMVILSMVLALVTDDLSEFVQMAKPERLPTISPTIVASPSATITPAHSGTVATVVSVVDGDTIKIEGGEIVRYIGMNTPETVAPGRPVECYGKEASAKNKELMQGKVVELERDISNRDKFGRLLRYVWLDGELINEKLVREGFAQVSTYPPDVKYEARLLEAQRQARSEEKGLWGGCVFPSPTPKPVPNVSSASATPSDVFPTP